MGKTKQSLSIEEKQHGVQTETHRNQYGDQSQERPIKKRFKPNEVDPSTSTINGDDNPVQDNAHDDSRNRSE